MGHETSILRQFPAISSSWDIFGTSMVPTSALEISRFPSMEKFLLASDRQADAEAVQGVGSFIMD